MLIKLKSGVRLGDTTYGKGEHSIPDEFCQGWFFDGLVKDGVVTVLGKSNSQVVEGNQPTMVDTIVGALKDEAKKLVKKVRK